MTRIKGLSGVVVSYNRRDVVETCLTAARVCEELIVLDKSSTDGTADIGRRIADKFYSVPWSPTVEGTRAEAISRATGEWILLLDDDECLNPEAIQFILDAMRDPIASIFYIPIKHYVMGRHDPAAYYWPEYRPSLFRRGALEFSDCVHGGVRATTKDVYWVPHDQGPAIEHLSHAKAETWVEKTNRYTSQASRISAVLTHEMKAEQVLQMLKCYLDEVPEDDTGYLTSVAALRGIYDVIDAVKRWEEAQPLEGKEAFHAKCATLRKNYAEYFDLKI